MFSRSRIFPFALAVSQTLRHVAFLGYDYWRYEGRSAVIDYLKQDLARPFFEPTWFCDAYISYPFGLGANLGLDMPAYIAGMLLHSLVNWGPACNVIFAFPRGQLLGAAFVIPVWFLAGLSIRRLSQRRWHPRARRFWRFPLWFSVVISTSLGSLMLAASLASVFVSSPGSTLRSFGFALWLFALAALCAERLRIRPFDGIGAEPIS